MRDTFLNAIEAIEAWRIGDPEPTVEYEVNYTPRQITLTEACGLVWNCNDILPGHYFAGMEEIGAKRQTYAAAAHAMHSFIASKPNGWRL